MNEPRVEAARFSAQCLLRKAWKDRGIIVESNAPIETFLYQAPDFIAKHYLGLSVEYPAFFPGNPDIAGFLERDRKLVGVITSSPITAQRFTFAHEIGHYMLHTNALSFRDRSLSAPDSSTGRPVEEREADAFAAELLIPRKFLKRAFAESFGEIERSETSELELLQAISTSGLKRISFENWTLSSSLNKATTIARLRNYQGRTFTSLADRFKVSASAMGIQLLQSGLLN